MTDNSLVMLCHKYEPKRMGLAGNFVSEKLDGQRLWWDSGITVGMLVKDIPWANKYDARKQNFKSTGLWSRLGSVVHAPSWWTAQLPTVMLDGECWRDYSHRQFLMSAIKKEDGTGDWKGIKFMAYDTPPAKRIFSERTVTYSGRKQLISGCMSYCDRVASVSYGAGFKSRLTWLREHVQENAVVRIHEQHEIPFGDSKQFVDQMLERVLAARGEGLVIKGRDSLYECARSYGALKMKPFEDAEGIVAGWISGEATEKGSRLLGMMGSLVLRLANGHELMLSGFTDAERHLPDAEHAWAELNPGRRAPEGYQCGFKTGLTVTFKYRGLTADGLPSEARYWREREDK